MKHIVSFSGGRTSAYLVHLMEQKRINEGWDVEYVFMDTGAEHPKTYEFVRNVVKYWSINLHCLKGNFKQKIRQAHTVDVVGVDDIGLDLVDGPFAQMMRKYGLPTVASPWCTSRMKEEVNDKFCESQGWSHRTHWIGYRSDEPARYFGKSCWGELRKYNLHHSELGEIFREALNGSDLMSRRLVGSTRELIKLRVETLKYSRLRYLAELSDFEKADILSFWKSQPFDLGIEEHLGNCVFCIKKSINKVALAMMDEPEILQQWLGALDSGSSRLTKGGEENKGFMYRGPNSNHSLDELFSGMTRDELFSSLKGVPGNNACAESCEPFGQMDLLGEAA